MDKNINGNKNSLRNACFTKDFRKERREEKIYSIIKKQSINEYINTFLKLSF